MARENQFTRHPQRAEIEKAIRAGASTRSIAGQFGIKAFSSVAEYARKLRARDAERAEDQSKKSDAEQLVERLDKLYSAATTFIGRLHDRDDFTGAIKAIAESRALCREVANLKGLLKPGVAIGININNANVTNVQSGERGGVPADEIKSALFRALRGHPEARDSVVHEFLRIQNRHDGVVIDGDLTDLAPRARTRVVDHDTAN